MKILLIEAGPYFGGQARHVRDLAHGLCMKGHDVSVVCRHPQLSEALRSDNIVCYRMPFHTGVDIFSFKSLRKIIRENNFDVVHTHGVRAGFWGRLAAKVQGNARLVHTVHTLAPDLVQGSGPVSMVRKSIYTYSEARLALLTDKVIAVSDDLRRRCIKEGILCNKLVTIHSGVDLAEYEDLEDRNHARGRIGVPVGCKLVGTIARFTSQKNLGDFLNAAKLVGKKYDDVMFVLVGDGPEANNLREQAHHLGISHRTVFTGARKDVAKILPGFDVFVLSSKWEGHPLAVLEAMAAGVPVVANLVTGIAETVIHEKTGITVQPGDVESLADGMIRCLSNPEESAVMGWAGRQRVIEKFSLDHMIRETEQLYLSLIAEGAYGQIAQVF